MNNIKKPKLLKRFAALIIDLMLWFLVALMSLSFIIDPIVNTVSNYNEKKDNYIHEMYNLNTYVYAKYVVSGETYYYEIIGDANDKNYEDIVFDDVTTLVYIGSANLKITAEELDNYVSNFYTAIDDIDTYSNNKIESDLFDDLGVALETATEDSLKEFYLEQLDLALESDKFKNYKDGYIYNLSTELNNLDLAKAYSSYIFSLAIFYLLIPVLNKKRQTVGKIIMHLEVIDTKSNNTATRFQMLIRFFAIVIIEFFISMLLSGLLYLPLLISIIMMVVTLNQSTIHDYIASTRVVDLIDRSNVYSDAIDAEYQEVDEKVEQNEEAKENIEQNEEIKTDVE